MATTESIQRLWTWPNLLTLWRPVSTPAFVLCCAYAPTTSWGRVGAVVLLGLMIGSDLLDGWLARRLQCSSAFGRLLDHCCDAGFVLVALSFFAIQQRIPWALPVATLWAFGLYVFDSWRRSGQRPRLLGSRLGHLVGVLNYAVIASVTVTLVTSEPLLPTSVIQGLCYGITALALLSGAERLWLSWWATHL